ASGVSSFRFGGSTCVLRTHITLGHVERFSPSSKPLPPTYSLDSQEVVPMRIKHFAPALLAFIVVALPLSAQRGGGGGGGGGGFGGAAPQQNTGPLPPIQEDFTGPVSADSIKVIIKDLTDDQLSTIKVKREQLKLQTSSLRDSLGRAAVV